MRRVLCLRTLLLTLLCCSLFAPSVWANPCVTKDGFLDNGIGGTGLKGGIGGTGDKRTENTQGRQGGDDDNGIGGTGVEDSNGIGGTGTRAADNDVIYVTGTIHAFGSVCVNGVEIEYTADTPVQTDSVNTLTASSLSIGQVVDVVAERKPGQAMPEAKSIAVRYPAEGRVTHVSPDGRSFTVIDKPVKTLDTRASGMIGVGDVVRVSGLENPHGELIASFVQKLPPDAPLRKSDAAPKPIPSQVRAVSVQGYVASVTPQGTVSMNGRKFHFGTTAGKLRVGTRIILSGQIKQDGSVGVLRWVHEKHPVGTKFDSSDDSGSDDSSSHNRGKGSDDEDDSEVDDDDHSGHGHDGDDSDPDDSDSDFDDDRDDLDHSGTGRDDSEDRSGSSNIEKIERPDTDDDRPEEIDRPDNSGSGKVERPEKADKVEKIEKPDKPDKPDNSGSGRPDRPDKPDKSGKG